VRYSYSHDGLDWVQGDEVFSIWDGHVRKSARVSPVRIGGEDAMALVYYDQDSAGEFLRWSYRLDSTIDPDAGWTPVDGAGLIRAVPASHPSMYRHWSVARDGQGGLHLSWEELDGIYYSRFDGDPQAGWSAPRFLVDGVYSNVTTSLRDGESYVYVVADNRQNAVVGAAYDPVVQDWTPFYEIGAGGRGPSRRASSPEQFVGGDGSRLPVLFQNENVAAPPTQLLFSVLLDCR